MSNSSNGVRPYHLALILGTIALAVFFAWLTKATLWQGPLESSRYQELRRATTGLRAMLEEYYGGPDILLNTWYVTPDHPAYHRAQEVLANKIARALVWRDKFVIGATGSSVTAGQGNCFRDSYTEQLRRLMEPIWAGAGVEFEVRNAGQTGGCGGSFDNQVWCVQTLAGEDADITHYSWSYFEAGLNPTYVQAHHELFYRWSLLMERSAIPHLVIPNDCKRMKKPIRDLLDVYAPLGADALCMSKGMRTAGYPAVKPKVIGDGLHTTTREGEKEGISQERRDSLGVVFRNWHPGPLLFQTTADALAHKLSGAMLLALDYIEKERHPKKKWPKQTRGISPDALPHPVACKEAWCSAPSPPRCNLYQKPTFGQQAFQRLETSTDKNNPWHTEKGFDLDRYMPKAERQIKECRLQSRCDGLVTTDSKQPARLSYRLDGLHLGHIAVCCMGKKCGKKMRDSGVGFFIDGQPLTKPPERFGASTSKCLLVQEAFPDSAAGPRSTELEILVPPLTEKLPAVSHIIGL